MASTAPITDHYRVELPCYSGPLDLLLYLVRRHEIDLNDIPMVQLTRQYLHHLTLIEHVDLDLAGEFLVMAATLLEIKSAMLMPRDPKSDDSSQEASVPTDPLDPRYELVQQLLAYKRFKDAAGELEDLRQQREACFPLKPCDSKVLTQGEAETSATPMELDLEDISILDLCEAFGRIMETVGRGPVEHEVIVDDTPIALHAEDILDRLKRDGPMTLQRVFAGRQHRVEMIGLFLAMLELVRQRAISVTQSPDPDDLTIQIELRPVEDAGEEETEIPLNGPLDDATQEIDESNL